MAEPCHAGIAYLTGEALSDASSAPQEELDWARHVWPAAVDRGSRYYAYRTLEYIKDIGTPERLARGRVDLAANRPARCSARTARACVFLDRDGVINRQIDSVRRPEELQLLPGAEAAIAALNQAAVPVICVTNQPGIAKGEFSHADLNAVHAELDRRLALRGAYLDDLYYCPHHPMRGFPGEVASLKINCECRKPRPGMLIWAAKRYNLDLARSVLIGDHDRDIAAGLTAGCHTIAVPTNQGAMHTTPIGATHAAADIAGAIDIALAITR